MKILIAGIHESTLNYQNALSELGAAYEVSLCPERISSFDALLLPGGDDIDPFLFGQQNTASGIIRPVPDRMQLKLLHTFSEAHKPILGICKGMQLINVCFGGTVTQHLPTASAHEYSGKDQVHSTTAFSSSVLHELYGSRFSVNSAHHQGIDKTGRELRIIQYADDLVPEALVHLSLPILGVQWHPERMCFLHKRDDAVDGSRLLSYFLSLVTA